MTTLILWMMTTNTEDDDTDTLGDDYIEDGDTDTLDDDYIEDDDTDTLDDDYKHRG